MIDWSEAAQGDALFDLATLTLGHPEHLGDVIAGYGTDVDLDVWWRHVRGRVSTVAVQCQYGGRSSLP